MKTIGRARLAACLVTCLATCLAAHGVAGLTALLVLGCQASPRLAPDEDIPAAAVGSPNPAASSSTEPPTAPPSPAAASSAQAGSSASAARVPDVLYVPTPEPVVARMLELARVGSHDLVYDLGCGDGRIVAAAAARHGARAVGYDIDPVRVAEARHTITRHGVEKLVQIEQRDIFTLDLSAASVVTLYLLPELNVRLLPQLERMKPGSRIVSHDFDIAGVVPATVERLDVDGKQHTIYFYELPLTKEPDPRVP